MNKPAIGAHGEYDHVQLLELGIQGGNCRQFRRSDEGEITRIEAKDDPFSLIV